MLLDPLAGPPSKLASRFRRRANELPQPLGKKLGVAGCASNAAADLMSSTVLINYVGGPSGGRFRNWTLRDPGTLTFCGFLQRTNGAVLAVSGPVQVNYRSGRSTVAIEAPEGAGA